MKKNVKNMITASTLLLTGLYTINRFIEANISPITPTKNEKTFIWKNTNINYMEKGNHTNPPLLLIHNLYPSSSKEEWYRMDDLLADNFHIYELDLPGCGKSDKPNQIYVNYMYVQLISDFIKEVINQKTNICAAAFSSSFTLMTARFHPDIIEKIIVINPTSIGELVAPVTKQSELKKRMLELPIIGTSLYNFRMNKSMIMDDYKYVYFYNDKNVPSKSVDISYFNAHYKDSNGKYLLSSIIGNYTNINIIHALSKIQNEIYLIGSGNYKSIIQEYLRYNNHINAFYVTNCRLLPQLEIPKTIVDKINDILIKK